MVQAVDTKLLVAAKNGRVSKHPVRLAFRNGRIEFLKSPFALKDEIKAMKSAKWHGFEEENPRKIWSVEDCFRNRFQLACLEGQNVYEWFDQPLKRHEYERPLMPHQKDLADAGLTYHYQIFAAEMGVGKSLAAQEVIERSSGADHWFWVGPKSSLPNIKREFEKWDFDTAINVEFYTYEKLQRLMETWQGNPPHGVVFDESSRLKNATSKRTIAAQKLADLIRHHYKFDGYVILMSGTPSPKRPTDWWSQCEIAWPGFLREGSEKALRSRLAFLTDRDVGGRIVQIPHGWRDDERKCEKCGQFADHPCHDMVEWGTDYHAHRASKNEVAYLFERLKGLVVIKHKKDCLALPEKRYRTIRCEPSKSVLRVAKTLANTAPSAITGLSLLRELSDGFQYREVEDGTTQCRHCGAGGKVGEWYDPDDEARTFEQTDMLDPNLVARLQKRMVDCPKCRGSGECPRIKRIAKEVPCPKVKALRELLSENEETGRMVIFAGFTGSVDRCMAICQGEGWDVVRCDGRGMEVHTKDGACLGQRDVQPLDYWSDTDGNERVAFVAHPESGGMSLTLTEARTAVFWSNSFKPEYRVQAEDRIHRKGMDENVGCEIVDLIHLPTDEKVLEVIRNNRRLELLTLGEFQGEFA